MAVGVGGRVEGNRIPVEVDDGGATLAFIQGV
jgi:hypothetical protein